MSGLSRDGQANSGNNNELESYQNKKDSEKKRREQENFYIEELAMLISNQLPEFCDSDDSSGGPNDPSRLEKGNILQETVDKLKKLNQTRRKDIQKEEVSSSRSFLPKEILGSLVLEALDGFMFITMGNEGSIEFVSDNVLDYLGFRQEDFLAQKIIFNFIHHGDHARFRVNLEPETWKTWRKLPQNTGGRQGFDRSKQFNMRFKINNEPKVESLEERQQRLDQYENMQVSAIAMSNRIENNQGEPQSGLFCICRRISRNERSGLTPVEQFTTRCHRRSLEIQTIDTEGLPQLYKTIISSHLHGKNLVELVHPQDRSLMKEHVEGFYKNVTDTSRVYRMILPSPMNVIHVKTKTKDFRPQPGHTHPGYIMSTHSIIRDHELQIEDLPAMRPELHGATETESRGPGQVSPLVQTLQSGAGSSLSPGPRPLPRPASRSPGQPGPASSPRLFSPGPGTETRSEMLEALLSPPAPVSPQQIQRHMGRLTPGASNGGGNELLKELLRPKENEQKSDGLCFKSGVQKPEETITIGQILNERPNDGRDRMETSELLKQLRKPPESVGRISNSELAQLLQKGPSASSMPIHQDLKRPSTSETEGPSSKQVPSLEKLLSVRPEQTVPPPVPRKWSERPQEKLPRDLIDKINKDAQSRNNNQPGRTNTRSPGTGVRGATPLGQQQPQRTIIRTVAKSPSLAESNSSLIGSLGPSEEFGASEFSDLLTDPVFSKILDGVDLGDDNIDHAICDQNLAKQKIHEIEQSLKLAEHSFSPTSSGPSLAQSVMTSALGGASQTSVLTSSNSSVMVVSQQQQQFSSVIQSGQPQHRILQQRNAGM